MYLIFSLVLPWWCFLLLTLILVFIFASFYEALAVSFALDILYGAPLRVLGGFRFAFTLFALASIILIFFLKKRLLLRELR